jgi:hypothetical protein
LVFWAFFQVSKQVPFFADGNPFAEDPYDAVGSFAIQVAAVLAVLSVLRSAGFLGSGDAVLARTQVACVLAVGITLASDAIALLKHGGRPALIVLVVAMSGLAVGAGVVCLRGARRGAGGRWAIGVCVVASLVLLFYPEATRSSLIGAFAAIAAGVVALFVPLRFLATALVAIDDLQPRRGFPYEWLLVLVAAAVAGFLVAGAEGAAEGGLREGVIFILISFEIAAAAFGYAMLRRPLGLTLFGPKGPRG